MDKISFYILKTRLNALLYVVYVKYNGDLYMWLRQDRWSKRGSFTENTRPLQKISMGELTKLVITGKIESDFKIPKEWEEDV